MARQSHERPSSTTAIEFKDLRQAEAAERYGSFRKAADALALRQSNLSRRIRRLEEQLGTKLFERTPGGVQPTLAGRHFAEELDELFGPRA
jgi:DNA-binding transcriptional LysR family regulator